MRIILASLLLAAPALADPPRALELEVSGSIDAGVIATSIAAELQRPVERATQTCHAPCLSVAIADAKATIVYTNEAGASRQRTVVLGDDAKQWPIVITLLAGNLVRDEAADVLALVPRAPESVAEAPEPSEAPEPPAPPSAVGPLAATSVQTRVQANPEGGTGFSFGFVPFLSTDLAHLDRDHAIAFSLVAGSGRNVTGFSMAGVADLARGTVDGVQLAGAVSVARGDVNGGQVAGAIDVTRGGVGGAQVAGAVSVAGRDVDGMQISGAVNVAGGRVDGTQIAGAVNLARGAVSGMQISGAVAVAGDLTGVQLAGAATVADRVDGAQVAGGINIAGSVSGVQIAPFNIAKRVDGLQIGVINIGGGPGGDSVGLINIVPGGRTDLEANVDSARVGAVLLRHGSRHWHNVYGVGGEPIHEQTSMPNNDVWMYGIGMGPSFHLGGFPAELEAMAWQVNHGARHEDRISLLNQLRLTVAFPLGPVALVAGGAVNVFVSSDHSEPFITARTTDPTDTMNTNVTVRIWPSVFVGARL